MGQALHGALHAAGIPATGPHGRGFGGADADVVLLCVPDAQIANAAQAVAPGPLVGHVSGASGLEELLPHRGFSLHPLMTVTPAGAEFAGAAAAVDAADPDGRRCAEALARTLGMVPVAVAAESRALYHAAASVASNFLITLEVAAETLAARAGLAREHLVPLVRASLENWVTDGAAALTGPVARGDEATVLRQRAAVGHDVPALLPLYDALVAATRAL
jgi:predicted short-subunit dehydrogenase-like oxidoreductase (DUF2520 family)